MLACVCVCATVRQIKLNSLSDWSTFSIWFVSVATTGGRQSRQEEADSVAAGDAPCQWDLLASTVCVWVWEGVWSGCHLSVRGLSLGSVFRWFFEHGPKCRILI